jgi:hypothetical protein
MMFGSQDFELHRVHLLSFVTNFIEARVQFYQVRLPVKDPHLMPELLSRFGRSRFCEWKAAVGSGTLASFPGQVN